MAIYAATVVIKRKDNVHKHYTIENIVVVGEQFEDMKRNHENLKRALKYFPSGKGVSSVKNDPERFVIVDIIIHKKLGL